MKKLYPVGLAPVPLMGALVLKVGARADVLIEKARTPPTFVGTKLYVRDRRSAVVLQLGS